MYLITGLHTGRMGFRVELHEAEPPVEEAWEEIAEASFRPESPRVSLLGWGGRGGGPLALAELDYRVRHRATGMAQARAPGVLHLGVSEPERRPSGGCRALDNPRTTSASAGGPT